MTPVSASRVRIAAVARRHLIVVKRVPFRIFDIVMWPIVDVVLYGSIGAFVTTQSGTATQASATYMLAGIMLFHFLYQTQVSNSTAFLEETWSRNLLNILTTPISEWEYAAGIAVVGLVKVVVGISVVSIAGLLLFAFNLFDLGLTLLPVAFALMVMGWAMSLFVIGLVLRFGQAAEAWTWGILFLVMPLSGIFYPVSSLPAVLRPIGMLLPTTYAFAAARQVLDGGPAPWGDLAWALLGAAVSVVVGIWFLGRQLSLFRHRGYVTRFS